MTTGNLLRKNTQTPTLIVNALLVGAMTLISTTPGIGQETNGPSRMKPTVVTGSYIPTSETVGASPVDVIGRQELEKVGTQDVLQTLRTFSPAFSGNGNVGQSLNNGGYGEAYLAIRNLPTLVLIDGKRLPISPFSTFVGTFSPDVNMIPVSFIDHIE